MTRIRRVATGFGALLLLTALVVGMPWALWHFIGWPLPHQVPNLSSLGHDLDQRGIPDKTLVDALAVACWLVWAVLAISVFVETIATARGQRAGRVPLVGLFQPLSGRLVAAVLVAALALAPKIASTRPGSGQATSLAASRPAATVVLTDIQLAATSTPKTVPPSSPTVSRNPAKTIESSATRTYVVKRGDTLWGIAERELGDPLRWREIAALNEHRPEGDAHFGDPHWIYPGWSLLLPAAGGDTKQVSPTPRSATAPTTRPTGGQAAQPITSPTIPATIAPASTAPAAGPVGPPASEHVVDGHAANDSNQRRPERAPIAPIGVGLLGVGLLGLLAGLRRVQQRHRREGRRIPLPIGGLADIERGLVAGANRDAAATLDHAIRLFSRVSRDAEAMPQLLGIALTSTTVRFELATPVRAALPFRDDGDAAWVLDLCSAGMDAELESSAGDVSLVPGLVTIGTDGEAIVLLNLEAGGTVAIDGDGDVASEVATAIGLELASASWVECAELVDAGIGTGMANPDRCTTVGALSEGLDLLRAHAERIDRELRRSGRESAAIGRLAAPDEDWSPLLLVSTEPPIPEECTTISTIAEPERRGIALVAPGSFPARWTLVANADGTIDVPMLGRVLVAQRVSRRHLAGVASVLGLAAQRADVAVDEEPYASISLEPDDRLLPSELDEVGLTTPGTASVWEPDGTDDVSLTTEEELALFDTAHDEVDEPMTSHVATAIRDPQIQVEVGVLGPLRLIGLTQEPKRGKGSELIGWLAMHPEGGSADRLATALWPSGKYSEHTLRTYRWDARRSLGVDQAGKALLAEYGEPKLSDAVSTDWARFRALAGSNDRSVRRAALELVRGRPFGDSSWLWLTEEGLVSAIEAEVTDLACALGAEDLELREPERALEVAEQGLLVVPYDERLYRLLMKAHHALGNPSGVRAAMHRLTSLLEDDIEPIETVHGETRDLYETLTSTLVRSTQHG